MFNGKLNEWKHIKKRYSYMNVNKFNNGFIMDYYPIPTVSSYLHIPIIGKFYTNLVLKWLVSFHNENHKNGIGHIHGDFSAYDIMIPEEVVVLDWEDYSKGKEQLIDVFYFIYKNNYSESPFCSKSNDIDFINHPILKRYLRYRGLNYSTDRIKSSFIKFLKYRIELENKNYSIPRRDRYIYRKMLKATEKMDG